jgi:hypothetical protein
VALQPKSGEEVALRQLCSDKTRRGGCWGASRRVGHAESGGMKGGHGGDQRILNFKGGGGATTWVVGAGPAEVPHASKGIRGGGPARRSAS